MYALKAFMPRSWERNESPTLGREFAAVLPFLFWGPNAVSPV